MKIITVSGAQSGIGKTALVERLLNRLENWSCLKVTVLGKGPCPRRRSCGVCREKINSFKIVSDPRIINQKGKDTQRMKAGGAKKVLWLKTTPAGLEKGLASALKQFGSTRGVIVEGTSVLKYLRPDLGMFIDAPGRIRLLRCSKIFPREK